MVAARQDDGRGIPVIDAPWFQQVMVGVYGVGLVVVAVVLGITAIDLWAAVEEVAARGVAEEAGETVASGPITGASLFLFEVDLTEGQAYLAMVLVFGMIGSMIHAATSFTTYVGNGKFKISWAWWYLLRPFVGGAVALILVMVVLGGLVTLSSGSGGSTPRSFNPYTVAAAAGLAGWFSKSAADKLEEVFDVILQNTKDTVRDDGLELATPPTITGLSPRSVVANSGTIGLTVTGSRFAEGARVQADGGPEIEAIRIDEGVLSVELPPVTSGPVEVVVINPDGSVSPPYPLEVLDEADVIDLTDDALMVEQPVGADQTEEG